MKKASVIFAIVIFAAVVAAATAPAQERMVLGYTNLQSAKMPVPLAKEAGLFAKHGLSVDFVRVTPGTTAVPKLLAGEIDIFLGNGDPVVKAIVRDGAKLAIIASLGEDSFRLVARPPIRTAADLKGKRVGVSNPGSSTDRIARAALAALKLDPDRDVELVVTSLNESRARLDLLLANGIDATIVAAENVVGLTEKDVVTVAELQDLGIFVSGADISVTRKLIETRRDALKRFLAAVVEAIARAKADPDLARRIYRDYANTTNPDALDWRAQEFVPRHIASVPHPSKRALASYFRDIGRGDPADFDKAADFALMNEVAAGR